MKNSARINEFAHFVFVCVCVGGGGGGPDKNLDESKNPSF